MNDPGNRAARLVAVGEDGHGQRIDNFLLRELKGVPRSHIYRLVRSGEVRVNSGRIEQTYRLQTGDRVRIPPVRMADRPDRPPPVARPGDPGLPILHEDDGLIAIDKPAGLAVHGGSGVSHGVIERLRHARPQAKFLELVHRIDRETSGVLLVAKKRQALTVLHEAWREGRIEKHYIALVKGVWRKRSQALEAPLQKYVGRDGERRMRVDPEGLAARTIFRRLATGPEHTLVDAEIETGRTHQIRVHLAHLGLPIVGDDRYGDFDWNHRAARAGLKRMFLHASRLRFQHPLTSVPLELEAPLPDELRRYRDVVVNFVDAAGKDP